MAKIFTCLAHMQLRVELRLIKFLLLSVICLGLIGFPGVVSAQVVDIPDANLRAAIAQALNKTPGDTITRADMETLVELRAVGRNITDLRGIEFAINLTHLNLFGNTLSDISPLATLTNLRWLELDRNTVSDISPLATLTNLRWLELQHNTISDISAVANLTNLTNLELWENNISDISAVTSLINLETLSLWDNTISDISAVANLTNLRYLALGGNNISDISAVVNLTNLRYLHVPGNNISDIDTLEFLMAQGTVVYFSGNPAFETPGPKIEDGWVGLIVPATDVNSGSDAMRSGRDFLAEASGGTVTEADVARNGARAGTRVGDSVWTAGTLDATDPNNLNTLLGYSGLTDIRYPVAYGVVPIYSETQQETRVYIGGGPVKVWINGTLVYKDTDHRVGSDYETAVPVLLTPGENLLFGAAYRPYPWERWGVFFGFQDGTVYTVGALGAGNLDVNGDGQVNVLDLVLVAVFYGTRGDGLPADVNADGIVDVQDFADVAAGVDAAGGLPQQMVEDLLQAAIAQAAALEAIGAAPMEGSTPEHRLAKGIVQHNVAAAVETLKHHATDDVRLRKWIPLLEELQQILAEMRATPETTALLPNYPNPFNPETWIPYHLAKAANVTLTIYDVRGSVVRELNLGHQTAGVYESRTRAAYWDGKNALGESVASGLYFYTLTTGDFTATRKLLIAK